MRLRIASDLHDDVGANLSLIAGVSEMLAREAQQNAPQMRSQLSLLAESSRRSMDAMSDIVWMISPNRDHLRDLLQRLRRFAIETLTPRQIEVKFALPDSEADFPIAAESRREIFLIGKEAINNIARHSACTEAEIALTLDGALMTLRFQHRSRCQSLAQWVDLIGTVAQPAMVAAAASALLSIRVLAITPATMAGCATVFSASSL